LHDVFSDIDMLYCFISLFAFAACFSSAAAFPRVTMMPDTAASLLLMMMLRLFR